MDNMGTLQEENRLMRENLEKMQQTMQQVQQMMKIMSGGFEAQQQDEEQRRQQAEEQRRQQAEEQRRQQEENIRQLEEQRKQAMYIIQQEQKKEFIRQRQEEAIRELEEKGRKDMDDLQQQQAADQIKVKKSNEQFNENMGSLDCKEEDDFKKSIEAIQKAKVEINVDDFLKQAIAIIGNGDVGDIQYKENHEGEPTEINGNPFEREDEEYKRKREELNTEVESTKYYDLEIGEGQTKNARIREKIKEDSKLYNDRVDQCYEAEKRLVVLHSALKLEYDNAKAAANENLNGIYKESDEISIDASRFNMDKYAFTRDREAVEQELKRKQEKLVKSAKYINSIMGTDREYANKLAIKHNEEVAQFEVEKVEVQQTFATRANELKIQYAALTDRKQEYEKSVKKHQKENEEKTKKLEIAIKRTEILHTLAKTKKEQAVKERDSFVNKVQAKLIREAKSKSEGYNMNH